VQQNRRMRNELYRHNHVDKAGPYLGDSLAMARASFALYRATGDRYWLNETQLTAYAIGKIFQHPRAGFYSAVANPNSPIKPIVQLDENMSVVRYFNLLAQTTGDKAYHKSAQHTLKFLTDKQVALSRITEAGILIIDNELNKAPLHIIIIGLKEDKMAQELYCGALKQAGWYKRIEWWDTREGKLPNPDVQYPILGRVAAFECTDSRCSLPLFSLLDLKKQISLSLKWKGG